MLILPAVIVERLYLRLAGHLFLVLAEFNVLLVDADDVFRLQLGMTRLASVRKCISSRPMARPFAVWRS